MSHVPGPGRPTDLTPEMQEAICRDLAIGTPRSCAAVRAGITYGTFKNWINRGETGEEPFLAFLASVEKAEADAEARNVGMIQKAAAGQIVVERTTVEHPDGSVETREKFAPPAWTAAAWWLERRRKGYGRRPPPVPAPAPTSPPVAEILARMPLDQLRILESILASANHAPGSLSPGTAGDLPPGTAPGVGPAPAAPLPEGEPK